MDRTLQETSVRPVERPSTAEEAKARFLAALPTIERLVEAICRRHGWPSAECEDFGQWVKLRLIENDYARLRRFAGRSSLRTFLTTVVHHLFQDHRNQKWGKWRPSAAARRTGPLAVELEKLIHRDGLSRQEAVSRLRARAGQQHRAIDFDALAVTIDRPPRPRLENDDQLIRAPATERADDGVREHERQRTATHTATALQHALAGLPAEDRLILKLRYVEGFTVARVARHLHLDQKPLYRRIASTIEQLRFTLEGAGLTAEQVHGILGWSKSRLEIDFGPATATSDPPGATPPEPAT